MDMLLLYLVKNESKKMPNSEWNDTAHMLVPCAYCDFVLLDKCWVSFIESCRRRLDSLAKVFQKVS